MEGVRSCCSWAGVAARASLPPAYLKRTPAPSTTALYNSMGSRQPLTDLLLFSFSAPITEFRLYLGKEKVYSLQYTEGKLRLRKAECLAFS